MKYKRLHGHTKHTYAPSTPIWYFLVIKKMVRHPHNNCKLKIYAIYSLFSNIELCSLINHQKVQKENDPKKS
jgi:hypothetical protein